MAENRWFDDEMPMNRDVSDPGAAEMPIVLAHEAAFALGHLTVSPPTRTVASGGWSQRLEPRAMQVLVLLARASPTVVGRSDLNARVWGGRVVGDDAINRTVQTLRRLAATAPAPAPFEIATIPRVGYRLVEGPALLGEAPLPEPEPVPETVVPDGKKGSDWKRVVAIAFFCLLVAAAATLWTRSGQGQAEATAWKVIGSRTPDDLPPGAMDLAYSPDGRRLAYRARIAAGRDVLFVRDAADGGAGHAVSPSTIDAHHPAWSTDGAALAFVGFESGRPCRLYVLRGGKVANVGGCETARDPRLAFSSDGRSLLFGDAPGENGVVRITALRLADRQRSVLSSPPGDSMGDSLPIARGGEIVFQRTFGWADEGWVGRDLASGAERLLWRRRGVAGSAAAALPDGALAIAWTRAGASGLDVIDVGGRRTSQPIAVGAVSAMSASGPRLLIEADRSESEVLRAGVSATDAPLASVRGRIAGPALLANGSLRLPVSSAGVARIWERDTAGTLHTWGRYGAVRVAGLAPRADGRFMAALVTGDKGREVVLFDAVGHPVFRWNPHARSVNPAAWSADGSRLIVPVLDGSGWRLIEIDPFRRAPPRDLDQVGFAVVQNSGSALYAVRAGESTGVREIWRLDGRQRRLPIDLTLFDIVNWRAVGNTIWLPDRRDRERPMLVLRNADTGAVLRRLPAPGLAGAGVGLAADQDGPVYVSIVREAPEYSVLQLE